MYRGFVPRYIFFAQFLEKTREKFIFGAIFATNQGAAFRTFIITNRSFYAPDSLNASGVTI